MSIILPLLVMFTMSIISSIGPYACLFSRRCELLHESNFVLYSESCGIMVQFFCVSRNNCGGLYLCLWSFIAFDSALLKFMLGIFQLSGVTLIFHMHFSVCSRDISWMHVVKRFLDQKC